MKVSQFRVFFLLLCSSMVNGFIKLPKFIDDVANCFRGDCFGIDDFFEDKINDLRNKIDDLVGDVGDFSMM